MKASFSLLTVLTAVFLTGCAATTMKQTWKSPNAPENPVHRVAVIGVDDRGLVRMGFENRMVRDLKQRGQDAIVTYELMTLPDIKADKAAAAAKLRQAGADSVLIIRLADSQTYDRSVRANSEMFVGTVTGMDTFGYTGWYDYYTVAYMDMGTIWTSDSKKVYLDSSLYDLASEKRIWSALTEPVLTDGTDPLVQADVWTAMVAKAMGKDGVTR